MGKTIWHKGSPPSIGWWPASNCQYPGTYRWWNGKRWSTVVYHGETAEMAGELASRPDTAGPEIFWKPRPSDWPARSRT